MKEDKKENRSHPHFLRKMRMHFCGVITLFLLYVTTALFVEKNVLPMSDFLLL